MITKRNNVFKQFQVLQKLGEGAFAQVFKVKRRQDQQIYALKKIRLNAQRTKDVNNALNQIRILASINSPYIVSFKEAFYDEISNNLCIVMEYAQLGDLSTLIETNKNNGTMILEETIWKAIAHLSKALRTLHQKRILHRDIKCANILISEGEVFKLADLNVSKVIKDDLARTQIGTPYYASPQIWEGKPYNEKSDMWSLGCIIYEMAAFAPPFDADNISDLFIKIRKGKFSRIPSNYSNDLQKMICKMLQMQPQKRPTASQILNSHSFLNNYQEELPDNTPHHEIKNSLLQTMVINDNIKMINRVLPKSKYEKRSKNNTQGNVDSTNMGRVKDISNQDQTQEEKLIVFQRNRISSAIQPYQSQRPYPNKRISNCYPVLPRNNRFSTRDQKSNHFINITNKKREKLLPSILKKPKIMSLYNEFTQQQAFNHQKKIPIQKENQNTNESKRIQSILPSTSKKGIIIR